MWRWTCRWTWRLFRYMSGRFILYHRMWSWLRNRYQQLSLYGRLSWWMPMWQLGLRCNYDHNNNHHDNNNHYNNNNDNHNSSNRPSNINYLYEPITLSKGNKNRFKWWSDSPGINYRTEYRSISFLLAHISWRNVIFRWKSTAKPNIGKLIKKRTWKRFKTAGEKCVLSFVSRHSYENVHF